MHIYMYIYICIYIYMYIYIYIYYIYIYIHNSSIPFKSTPKIFSNTILMNILCKNQMKYIVYKYFRNKNIFKRRKYPFVNESNTNYFLTLSFHHRGILASLNHPPSNS